MKKTILIIDDEETLRKAVERHLKSQGYDVTALREGGTGLAFLRDTRVDLLLVDLMLPGQSGIHILQEARRIQPGIISIVMTGYGTIPSAIEAVRAGAYHYVTKPFDLEDLSSLIAKALDHRELREENRQLRQVLAQKYGLENIVGSSPPMRELFSLVERVADSDSTILLMGESGTGKELVACAIHQHSRRKDRPFVTVNCAAIPENLLESELFGHTKGAFTGAVTTASGKFEQADQGTLFLDEIGDMSLKLQVKLLRVLQDRKVTPVGSVKSKEVDVRVVAATNQTLSTLVQEGRFREDLFYRLNVIPMTLPPLRERLGDLPFLVNHFLEKYNRENRKTITGFSEEAEVLMKNYRWPGNVRELENLVERLVVVKESGKIELKDLPSHLVDGRPHSFFVMTDFPEKGVSFKDLVDEFENHLIQKALEKSGGNKNKAASFLKLNRTTLVEKLKRINGE